MIGSDLSSRSLRISRVSMMPSISGMCMIGMTEVEMFAIFDPLQGFTWMFRFARAHAPLFSLKLEDAAVGGIVVHDEDALILQDGLNAFDVARGFALGDLCGFSFDR